MKRQFKAHVQAARYQLGLLLVACVLAVGLASTAYLSYRQTRRNAVAVLESRAIEIANAVAASARVSPDPPSAARAQQILDAHATAGEVGLSLFRVDGERVAAVPKEEPQSLPPAILAVLRIQGQTKRLDGDYLTYYRFVRAGRRHMGPPPRWGHGLGRPPGPPWHGRSRRARIVRVRVSRGLSAGLIRSATTTLGLAGASGALLIALGVVLYVVARRAARTEERMRAREALAELGELGAVVAHEIRTPLASIKGNAQLLAEKAPDDPRSAAIVAESARLERLVNGLLDYTRPAVPSMGPVDLSAVLGRAIELVAGVAERESVALIADPESDLPAVEGEEDTLLQVVVNLLRNAIEASSAREGAEAVVTITLARDGGRVVLRVMDRGSGLSMAEEEAFRPFSTTKSQGTGLGLSVSRQIVAQHGGTLRLRSRAQGGAIAELSLPIRRIK